MEGGGRVLSQEVGAFWASDAFFLALTAASTLKMGDVVLGGRVLFFLAEIWDVPYLQLDMWESTSGRVFFVCVVVVFFVSIAMKTFKSN